MNTALHAKKICPRIAFASLFLVFCQIHFSATVIGEESSDAEENFQPENAKPDVKYVGTLACTECHKPEHDSYLQTTHSLSAKRTDARTEPAGESFRHPLTGDEYQIAAIDGKLVHREIRFHDDRTPSGQTEVTVDYSIGSGSHGKSYAYHRDGMWRQSPVSWFQDTGHWGMSPGYEGPLHQAFGRKLTSGCFFCHVGSVDQKEKNPFQFEILEVTIGCERCHGPGELHVKKHQSEASSVNSGVGDSTIVNPERLSRELSEAICQQCHLQGAAHANVSQQGLWDYRPGLPLTDFRVDYQERLGSESMKIVGHVEQLHQSKCYQQSETLTCVTCHDPHNTPSEKNRVELYRSVCIRCHEDQSCGKPIEERITLTNNDCASCHMPKSATDVIHAAFSSHRIGIHDSSRAEAPNGVPELFPVLDLTSLSEIERKRCAALAKIAVLRNQNGNPVFAKYAVEAVRDLIDLKNRGSDDAELNSGLAWLASEQGQKQIATTLARRTRALESAPTDSRIMATRILAQAAFQQQKTEQAVELYRELSTYVLDANDLYYLGLCEQNAGNTDRSIAALEKSIEMDPNQDASHIALHAIYQATGRRNDAEQHRLNGIENQAKIQQRMKQANIDSEFNLQP